MLFDDEDDEEDDEEEGEGEEQKKQEVSKSSIHRRKEAGGDGSGVGAAPMSFSINNNLNLSSNNNFNSVKMKIKNPFMEHKQLVAKKQKKADEETARLYDEFVASFEADNKNDNSNFVSGGLINSDKDVDNNNNNSRTGSRYIPSFLPESSDNNNNNKSANNNNNSESNTTNNASIFSQVNSSKSSSKNKTKEIDIMLEEMKRVHDSNSNVDNNDNTNNYTRTTNVKLMGYDRASELRRLGMNPGSFDDGDPTTTNLYIGNIAPTVDEQVLMHEFGRFGAVASVKIMWPRTEEQFSRGRNCGFVAFMQRSCAEAALNHMDNVVIHTHEIKVGWGKAVKELPKEPIYSKNSSSNYANVDYKAVGKSEDNHNDTVMRDNVVEFSNEKANGKLEHGMNDNDNNEDVDDYGIMLGFAQRKTQVPAQPRRKTSVNNNDSSISKNEDDDVVIADVCVTIPPVHVKRYVIDTMASYVAQDGHMFEKHIMSKEYENAFILPSGGEGNPTGDLFRFLWEPTSAEGVYYTWRVFSLANGDNLLRWRTEPFFMVEGGPRWIPPMLPVEAALLETGGGTGNLGMDAIFARRRRQLGKNGLKTQEERERERAPTAAQRKSTYARSDVGGGSLIGNMRRLEDEEQKAFMAILDSLSSEREHVANGMLFVMDRADAAAHVAELIIDMAVHKVNTPLPRRIALLFLISDILYNTNTSVRNASKLRTVLQPWLPFLMAVLSGVLNTVMSNNSRMTAMALRRHVNSVLKAWRSWFLFPEEFISGLAYTFAGGPQSPTAIAALAKLRQSTSNDAIDFEGHQRAAMELTRFEEDLASIDMVTLTRYCKIGGLPSGERGEMVERLTGMRAEKLIMEITSSNN